MRPSQAVLQAIGTADYVYDDRDAYHPLVPGTLSIILNVGIRACQVPNKVYAQNTHPVFFVDC